jgi:hypothetical protein
MNLYFVQKPEELITYIEGPQQDHICRFVSTTELLWVDDRFPEKPLLGYKHGRRYDRTLATHTEFFKQGKH